MGRPFYEERGPLDILAINYLCNMIVSDAQTVHQNVDYTNSITTFLVVLNNRTAEFLLNRVEEEFEPDYFYRLIESQFIEYLNENVAKTKETQTSPPASPTASPTASPSASPSAVEVPHHKQAKEENQQDEN